MQHDPRYVSQDLEDQTNDHAGHVSPCLVLDAEVGVGKNEKAKEGGEEDIAAVAGEVGEDGTLGEAAGVEGAVVPVGESCVAAGVWVDCHGWESRMGGRGGDL